MTTVHPRNLEGVAVSLKVLRTVLLTVLLKPEDRCG